MACIYNLFTCYLEIFVNTSHETGLHKLSRRQSLK